MVDLSWSPTAAHNLESIRAHIARDSPASADLLVRRLIATVERLRLFPKSGRVVPEFNLRGIRELIWRDYRIVYRVNQEAVEIVAVMHGARLLRLRKR